MSNTYNDKMKPYWDLAFSLANLIEGINIKIPVIIICGPGLPGKTKTLESLIHVPLSKGDITNTICPIKIFLLNLNEEEEEFARIKYAHQNEEDNVKVSLDQIEEKLFEYKEKLKRH